MQERERKTQIEIELKLRLESEKEKRWIDRKLHTSGIVFQQNLIKMGSQYLATKFYKKVPFILK